jgi:hypothetical protein
LYLGPDTRNNDVANLRLTPCLRDKRVSSWWLPDSDEVTFKLITVSVKSHEQLDVPGAVDDRILQHLTVRVSIQVLIMQQLVLDQVNDHRVLTTT